MSVLTGALGSLAPKLLQLLHGEYKLQKGVRKQVQWLHSELDCIHAFLRKVSDVPWDRLDEQVKVWAREVREASYDMEDVLDTFLVHVDGGEPADPSRLKRTMKKMGKVFGKAKARRSIARAIEGIKKHLEEVGERRQKYKLDDIVSKPVAATSSIDPRLTAMYKEVTQLIGVDKSSDELMSMLIAFHPDDDACVDKITKKVSVVGVGGLGKTTLAKVVYDKLKSQYDCGAFVSVGRDHDLVKVFKDILFDLDKNKYENIHNTGRGVGLLIREVREFLENKRYFLVVDDVWEVQTWKRIQLVLVENNCGSKVITTTRKLDVAEEAGEVYKLKPLSMMGELFSKAKARRDIAGKIQDMTKHLEEVAGRRQKYKLDEIMCKQCTSTSSIDPRLTAMYKEVTQLIGVDKSRDELIFMLNPSQPDLLVSDKKMKKVSIVGVGGLGKTTLAKVVYDKIKAQYDCGAFVSIGRDHDLAQVFKDILFLLDKKNHREIHNTGRGVELLVHQLREFLEKKRYFIVIDDVWEVRTWETIQLALVDNNCGSKVITTTRKFDVAEQAGQVYKLKPLSYDDSMKLFYTRILGADRKHLDNQPDDVSDKLLKKCAGIPLAIITMSSLFAGKPECQWSEVYNSIGFDTKDNRESGDTMAIVSFSYYDLPLHLRPCLLYLSAYPEDYEIRKESLIWKWIAEGFICPQQGTRLFELGEIYFNDLINRSMIQIGSRWEFGRVSICRVHDMVLDLLRKLSSEENFIAILGDNVKGTPALSNVRRLAQQNRIAEHINSEAMVAGIPKVRSYTAFMSSIDNQDLFLRFKLLRVLDIYGRMFKEGYHLEHLGDLIHLRYLGIRVWNSNDHLELPKQIGNLKLLQTLDVYGTLPPSIVQLTQLVRLDAYHSKAPDGFGNLTSLEELRIRIRGHSETETFMKELGSLQELRVLRFSTGGMNESTQRHFVKSLHNLKKIQQIEVHGFVSHADTAVWEAAGFVLPRPLCYLNLFNQFSKLLSCINPSRLPNLSHLRLRVTTMDEQDLKLLARLPVLYYLSLGTESTVTASNINAGDGCFFQKLRYFGISGMVQFEQPNEEDSSVSLHMWNGVDAMPFGSRRSKDSNKTVPSGVMPNVEILEFDVYLPALKVNNGDCRNTFLPFRKLMGLMGGSAVMACLLRRWMQHWMC